MTIDIVIEAKAMSVNKVWQGRRFKTKEYKDYEEEIYYLLPKKHLAGEVQVHYTFYLKNYSRTDIDNLIKPLQDILVKKLLIEDDRKIVYLTAKKIKSKKDKIEIKIEKL